MRRWAVRALLAVAALPALLAAAIFVSGLWLAAPHARAVGRAPADLGAETVVFPSASGSAIHGWLVRGEAGKGAVLLLHGVNADRREMLGRMRLLHAAGFAVLAIDLQAHGESPGAHITFGHLEALDAEAALAALRRTLPGERIGVIGLSLGGAAALLGPHPLTADALVLEAVFPDIDSALRNRLVFHVGRLGRVLTPCYEALLPLVLGVRADELRPIDRIGDVASPLLMLAGTRDRYTTIAESRAMFARAPRPKQLFEVEGAGHADFARYAPEEYQRRVLSFLAEHLSLAPR